MKVNKSVHFGRRRHVQTRFGCDEISVRMIKLSDYALVYPLKLIFSNSIRTGVFPNIWKLANVVPVHKKDKKNLLKNYRPISLLPIFGKIFEKLIYNSLCAHIVSCGLLNPNQSGFRPGDSTINQLLAITNYIFQAFDCNPPHDVRAVFLDLSKAFDRVWHDGLIYKLQLYGVSGLLLTLFKSFLTNRKIESVQYSAALAVTGAWRGTSRDKLYNELGWESLDNRRWYRRLTLFYKVSKNHTPDYTRDPIPPLHQSEYSLRNQQVTGQLRPRTERFKSSFYPSCLMEWSKLSHLIRASPTIASFKSKLLVLIRPTAKSVYGIHDPVGLSYLTQLRVGLSRLNFHKFRHNFGDTIDAMCPSNDGIENEEHFLLLCPSFDTQRRNLLDRTLLFCA